jgi:archaellum component FlaC
MILTTSIGVGSAWGVLGIVVGGIITYLTGKNKTSSDVEIAKINSTSTKFERDIEGMKNELKEMTSSYHELKSKYHHVKEKNKENISLIESYENLLRHYRFIFKLAYEMIAPKLEEDSEAMVLLDEVRDMFSEDFKL